MKYTTERNVQIIIALLKANGIRKIVASPGTTNFTFIGSLQNDPYFEIYSSVDERSAAYLACGMAEESGEPVVLSCTGATASRNYMPGLTEAYYRKLPVLAITSHRGDHAIGHLLDQQIDRRNSPSDIAVLKVQIPLINNADDEWYCTIQANKAIHALRFNGGGPVHINLLTGYSKDFSVESIPAVRNINLLENITLEKDYLINKRTAIFIGAHKSFTREEEKAVDDFCSTYDAVVFCDHTSGYQGKYRIDFALVCSQKYYVSPLTKIDVLIHIGEVSGNAFGLRLAASEVWRVSSDGQIRDTFRKLTRVYYMSEYEFFESLGAPDNDKHTYLDNCVNEYNSVLNQMPDIPFSNIWVAKQICPQMPSNSVIHFGILNSLRSWNFFNLDKTIRSYCNVGGFGIDGGVSSLMGAAMVSKEKLFFGIFGDLAFFYDMNVIGNRHVGNNVRIMLINNGRGTEFRISFHPCAVFGEDADKYMAAAGHYGNKSNQLIKHYAQDLGYDYISASTKEEFLENYKEFIKEESDKPIIFEIFTDSKDETLALDTVVEYIVDSKLKAKTVIRNSIKETLNSVGAEKIVKLVQKLNK